MLGAVSAPRETVAASPRLTKAGVGSPLLCLPDELWPHIFGGETPVTQLTRLRKVCKSLYRIAGQLMPLVARELHPAHAKDPRVADPLFAEALIAAHQLNVASPYQVMVARDGTIDAPPGNWETKAEEAADDASAASTRKGPTAGATSAAALTSINNGTLTFTSTAAPVSTADTLPSKQKWMIGSLRMLHLLHGRGRPWPFAVCSSCNIGTCARCRKRSNDLTLSPEIWWARAPVSCRLFTVDNKEYSNAILGKDACFCPMCTRYEGESSRCDVRQARGEFD